MSSRIEQVEKTNGTFYSFLLSNLLTVLTATGGASFRSRGQTCNMERKTHGDYGEHF